MKSWKRLGCINKGFIITVAIATTLTLLWFNYQLLILFIAWFGATSMQCKVNNE